MNSPMFAQRTSGNSAKAPAEPYAACGAAHGLSLPFGNSRLWLSTELYYANFSNLLLTNPSCSGLSAASRRMHHMVARDARLDLEPLCNERELARIIGRSIGSLRRDRMLGIGIPFIRLGKLIRYDPRDVREYL